MRREEWQRESLQIPLNYGMTIFQIPEIRQDFNVNS